VNKKGFIIAAAICVLGGIGFYLFKSHSSPNSPSSSVAAASTTSQATVQKSEPTVTSTGTVEKKDEELGIPLYSHGQAVQLKDLKPVEQRAVRFVKAYIDTEPGETEAEQFQRLKKEFLEPGGPNETEETAIMGKKYLPPFQANRHLEGIYLNGTLDRKVSYVVFMRVFFNKDSMDIPLTIEKGTNYVIGYSTTYPGKPLDHPQN
jgi:hypothetical protein